MPIKLSTATVAELRKLILGSDADTATDGTPLVTTGAASVGSLAATGAVTGASINGVTNTSAAATSRYRLMKAVTGLTDNSAGTAFTVTVPNAAHSAMIRVTLIGSLGAGGDIGVNEATHAISYDIAVARTPGVATVATASSAYGSANSAVAGATTITTVGAVSGMTGAVSVAQTFTITVKVTKGGGSSAAHTALCFAELLNANATGVTIA